MIPVCSICKDVTIRCQTFPHDSSGGYDRSLHIVTGKPESGDSTKLNTAAAACPDCWIKLEALAVLVLPFKFVHVAHLPISWKQTLAWSSIGNHLLRPSRSRSGSHRDSGDRLTGPWLNDYHAAMNPYDVTVTFH